MSTNLIGTKNRRFYICSLSCDTIVYKVKLVILVVLTLSLIIIIIISSSSSSSSSSIYNNDYC